MKNYRFIVNEKKRTITCIVRNTNGIFVGIAKCDQSDVFDENVGKEIARKRAILKSNMTEFRRLKFEWTEKEMKWYESQFAYNRSRKTVLKENIKKLNEELNKLVK